MKIIKIYLSLFILFFITACGSLLTTDIGSEKTYILSAIQPSISHSNKAGLSVAKPLLASGLDSQKIALIRDNIKLDYYAGARWSDNLSIMVQDRLIESIQNAKIYQFVVNDKINLRPTYILVTDVRRFQAVYDKKNKEGADTPPTIHIAMDVKLINISNRQISRQFSVSSKVRASGNRMGSIANAMDQSFKNVQRKVIQKLR